MKLFIYTPFLSLHLAEYYIICTPFLSLYLEEYQAFQSFSFTQLQTLRINQKAVQTGRKNAAAYALMRRERFLAVCFFVKLGGNFRIIKWLAVMSATKFIKPDSITFFASEALRGCWWNRTKSFVNVEIVPKQAWVTKLNGKQVTELAHKSDFLRIEMLYRRGGIYMDTDIIVQNSFDPLLNEQVILSEELPGVPDVGVLVARKHSCFMCNFMKKACQNFNGGWTSHSVQTLRNMYKHDWKKYNGGMILKRRVGFVTFDWSEIRELYEVNIKKLSFDVSQAYSIHLYNHIAAKYLKKLSNYTWISENPSAVAHAIRRVLPEGFSKEHLDENRCIDL